MTFHDVYVQSFIIVFLSNFIHSIYIRLLSCSLLLSPTYLSLLSHSQQVETYHLPASDTQGDHHGTSGPLHIGPGSFQTAIGDDFIKTGLEYDEFKKEGRTFKRDTNDFETIDKYAVSPSLFTLIPHLALIFAEDFKMLIFYLS
jgi:hypothetical protein